MRSKYRVRNSWERERVVRETELIKSIVASAVLAAKLAKAFPPFISYRPMLPMSSCRQYTENPFASLRKLRTASVARFDGS